jgi:HD-like signal output (HDOD) protein
MFPSRRSPPQYGKGDAVVALRPEEEFLLEPTQVIDRLKSTFQAPGYTPPLLPAVVFELMRVARDPDATRESIATLLTKDPFLTASVLRLAQSAAFRRGQPVRTIDQAIGHLGLRTLSDLFLQASMTARVFRAPGYEAPMLALRAHSIATGTVARIVCEAAFIPPDNAFVCGILHDVGKAAALVALADLPRNVAPPRYDLIESAVDEVHESCTGVVTAIWNLPTEICAVVAHHHDFHVAGRMHPLAAAVCLADALVSELGFPTSQEIGTDQRTRSANALGLDKVRLDAIRRAASRGLENIEAK